MNTNSINGFSSNFLQSTLASQLTSNSLNSPSKSGKASDFSQMLDAAGATTSASSGGNFNQLLSQLVGNFQSSGVQNQGQSLDPMAISA